jgi:hypothetical protein
LTKGFVSSPWFGRSQFAEDIKVVLLWVTLLALLFGAKPLSTVGFCRLSGELGNSKSVRRGHQPIEIQWLFYMLAAIMFHFHRHKGSSALVCLMTLNCVRRTFMSLSAALMAAIVQFAIMPGFCHTTTVKNISRQDTVTKTAVPYLLGTHPLLALFLDWG